MNERKKVLIITPIVPYPESGAEQIDRANGIRQLKRLGFDVMVIAKRASYQTDEIILEAEKALGVQIRSVYYKYSNTQLNITSLAKKFLTKLKNPMYLDGAALEYAEPEIVDAVKMAINDFAPDYCWFDYTYLWPLYDLCKHSGAKIITRSINYEPEHFLDEDGRTMWNRLKTLPKIWSERLVAKKSDHVFSITPKEEIVYRGLGASASTLPLRGLHNYLFHKHEIRDRRPLKVFFMGSTYNVSHNRAAAEMLLKEIIPDVNKRAAGDFEFYIYGKKLPNDLENLAVGNVHYMGYQDDLMGSLSEMDMAIVPSVFGAGMQQKIFEPLSLGIPTVTSGRGIAGYPFKHNEHVLLCENVKDFTNSLIFLKDIHFRSNLSRNSKVIAEKIFSSETMDNIILGVLGNPSNLS